MSNRKSNKKPKLHVKREDTVRVISGKDRGKEGRILRIIHSTDKHTGEVTSRAIVEGLNLVSKHRKPDQQNPQGSIVETEAGIHVAKLMLIDPKDGKPTRIGRQKTENGWVRVSKRTGNIIK